MKIIHQLKTEGCSKNKSRSFRRKHYTMTRWKNEASLSEFEKTGNHLMAMKKEWPMAKEIKTLTLNVK